MQPVESEIRWFWTNQPSLHFLVISIHHDSYTRSEWRYMLNEWFSTSAKLSNKTLVSKIKFQNWLQRISGTVKCILHFLHLEFIKFSVPEKIRKKIVSKNFYVLESGFLHVDWRSETPTLGNKSGCKIPETMDSFTRSGNDDPPGFPCWDFFQGTF